MITTENSPVSAYSHRDQRTIFKYLEQYAEAEAGYTPSTFESFPESSWDYVVTIPACGEDEFLPGTLSSINNCQLVQRGNKILCLIVLNGNEAREEEYAESNEKTRSWFKQHCSIIADSLNPVTTCPQTLLRWKNIDILIVDRSQQPWLIPADQGVGLVRKIAADCALALIVAGKINSPWIHITDADARVPDDYFKKISELLTNKDNSTDAASCFIYPYQHIPDPDMEPEDNKKYWPALRDYEIWLRYYVAGLQWAGSSYAYPSIGSLLACNALAYARIRGFPRRMAGEDFYFQNKLAKTGQMVMLHGQPVKLLTRVSTRVPFGTGQGTISIEKMNSSGQTYMVYHPLVFDVLKSFHQAVQAWFDTADLGDLQRQGVFLNTLEGCLKKRKVNCADNKLWMQNLIVELDIFKHLHAAEKRSKSSQGAKRQFDDWFDGFRTLKLIHRLRDDLFGSLPLLDALQCASFLCAPELDESREDLKEAWLEAFRATSS